jgi:type VI secretion system secreted protein VgrG
VTRYAKVFVPIVLLSLAGGGTAALAAPVVDSLSRLSVTTPLGDGVLRLVDFQGREAVSELFSFRLGLVAQDGATVPFEAVLGKEVRVTVSLPSGETRFFNGICNRLSQGDQDGVTRYEAEIVPRAWLLTRRSQSRIFQGLSVPQILAQVLGGVPGLSFELRLQGEFAARDYCVQYRETDFDFISRLMEEEGISYFFTHGSDRHTMVLVNTPDGNPALADAIPFRRDLTFPARGSSVFAWAKAQEIRSGKVTLWDHNFETPGLTLEGSATIQESVLVGQIVHRLAIAGNDQLEVYDYPGGYAKRFDGIDPAGGERPEVLLNLPEEARRTAGLRMQEEAARGLGIEGVATAPTLTPGHAFILSQHPSAGGRYLLTSVQHAARVATAGGAALYHDTFTCIPSGLPFRPARTTPRPVIPGTQTAVVVGPPGEEIFTDKYGRVKVQFHWDRQGQKDESSSFWIRVAQPYADGGSVLIPRVGWEVVVSFLDGDPDQPIIVGTLYNPDRPPPPPPRAAQD